MCKPISFISDGKGNFKYIDFDNRQLAAAGNLKDKKGRKIEVSQCDSHTAIAELFGKQDDLSNKYEYDYENQKIEVDQINVADDYKQAKEWAPEVLNELVAQLITSGNDESLIKVLPHLMTKDSVVIYAAYAAEQVLSIFEKQFPNDDRPRKAVEAAKTPGITADTAANAAYAASAASYAAYAAAYAASRAANAAYAASRAADATSRAASRAADATSRAASYAANAASRAGKKEMTSKIVSFGRKLVKLYE